MASRDPDPVPEPALWRPAWKGIALGLARSARPSGPSASDTSTSGTRLHRLHGGIGAGQSLVNDFADPLGDAAVGDVGRGAGQVGRAGGALLVGKDLGVDYRAAAESALQGLTCGYGK